ncbi:hypothetical protein EUGRSUZ_F03317 [Eucalyptus grandis]|uniref:Uncharacterized protein n=2 Tax=Eucalyptus grandis TaxID=71139 RepID=A0A059BVQ2_EUCGR|nr:hypothetical protein EUGRSUZ_F03317 [Eucalyptus grandis]
MATPVARSLFNGGKASLRFVRSSLLCRPNTATVEDQSLLAPSGVVLGQSQFWDPLFADVNRQVTASIPHLLGRSSLVGGEDRRRDLGREYLLSAGDELEMRRRQEVEDENEEDDFGSEDGGFDSDCAVGWEDFDDDDEDGDDDDEDDGDSDAPRERRK